MVARNRRLRLVVTMKKARPVRFRRAPTTLLTRTFGAHSTTEAGGQTVDAGLPAHQAAVPGEGRRPLTLEIETMEPPAAASA